MKNTSWIWIILLLVSCNARQSEKPEYITAEIRDGMKKLTTLDLADEIESVTYVPLEITSDDASLIADISNIAITKDYMYIVPMIETRIVLFDRQGKFIKTLIPHGQGPGEYSGGMHSIQADEKNNRLYLFDMDRTWVFTLDGEPIENIPWPNSIIFANKIGEDRFAAVSYPFMPFDGGSSGIPLASFENGSFGIGIFTEKGDTIVTKKDFYSSLVPREQTGFTMGLTYPAYSAQTQSLLFKTASNDTVFRLSEDKILPACILNLKNSDDEIIRGLDASKYPPDPIQNSDIYVMNMFETLSRYYFRLELDKKYYIASVDKKTGETKVEQCAQNATLEEMSAANILFGMLGTKSFNQFPIWGHIDDGCLVQIVTPTELNLYRDIRSVSIPDELNVDDDDNPIVIFYKLKATS